MTYRDLRDEDARYDPAGDPPEDQLANGSITPTRPIPVYLVPLPEADAPFSVAGPAPAKTDCARCEGLILPGEPVVVTDTGHSMRTVHQADCALLS